MARYEFAAMLYRAMQKGITVDGKLLKEFQLELVRSAELLFKVIRHFLYIGAVCFLIFLLSLYFIRKNNPVTNR